MSSRHISKGYGHFNDHGHRGFKGHDRRSPRDDYRAQHRDSRDVRDVRDIRDPRNGRRRDNRDHRDHRDYARDYKRDHRDHGRDPTREHDWHNRKRSRDSGRRGPRDDRRPDSSKIRKTGWGTSIINNGGGNWKSSRVETTSEGGTKISEIRKNNGLVPRPSTRPIPIPIFRIPHNGPPLPPPFPVPRFPVLLPPPSPLFPPTPYPVPISTPPPPRIVPTVAEIPEIQPSRSFSSKDWQYIRSLDKNLVDLSRTSLKTKPEVQACRLNVEAAKAAVSLETLIFRKIEEQLQLTKLEAEALR
ncbi:hypothetical protein AAMO2058_000105900 [Amorphochlora amoebiformis]